MEQATEKFLAVSRAYLLGMDGKGRQAAYRSALRRARRFGAQPYPARSRSTAADPGGAPVPSCG